MGSPGFRWNAGLFSRLASRPNRDRTLVFGDVELPLVSPFSIRRTSAIPFINPSSVLEVWFLQLPWSLVLGFWSFADSAGHASRITHDSRIPLSKLFRNVP